MIRESSRRNYNEFYSNIMTTYYVLSVMDICIFDKIIYIYEFEKALIYDLLKRWIYHIL